jgi:hypothetical protein
MNIQKYKKMRSVSIKFPNWRYYSDTTNAIYWGRTRLVRENAFIYKTWKFQLVCMVTNYFEVSFYVVSKVSKWNKEQRLSFVYN